MIRGVSRIHGIMVSKTVFEPPLEDLIFEIFEKQNLSNYVLSI